MTSIPCTLIVLAANVENMNRVFDAQGRGNNTFGRALVAAGTTGPVVARLAHDASGTPALEAEWRAMASDRDLPAILGTWGVDGVISEADAKSAMAGFTVYSVGEIQETTMEWITGILSGRGYEFEPEAGI